MGALIAQEASAGKVVITDLSDSRLDDTDQMGVQHVVDAARTNLRDVMADHGMTQGLDVGLEMSGSDWIWSPITCRIGIDGFKTMLAGKAGKVVG